RDVDLVVEELVDEPVLVVDPAGPVPLEVLEQFGLADAFVAGAVDVGDQSVDPPEHPAVVNLPPEVVLPGAGADDHLHSSTSSRTVAPPASSSVRQGIRRRAVAGLRPFLAEGGGHPSRPAVAEC